MMSLSSSHSLCPPPLRHCSSGSTIHSFFGHLLDWDVVVRRFLFVRGRVSSHLPVLRSSDLVHWSRSSSIHHHDALPLTWSLPDKQRKRSRLRTHLRTRPPPPNPRQPHTTPNHRRPLPLLHTHRHRINLNRSSRQFHPLHSPNRLVNRSPPRQLSCRTETWCFSHS